MNEAYKKALKNCRKSMKNKETKMDAFDFSTFLAIAFNLPKEQTLDDLVEEGIKDFWRKAEKP